MAFGVRDVAAVISVAAEAGFQIAQPAKTTSHGGFVVGFVKDLGGFLIESIGVH